MLTQAGGTPLSRSDLLQRAWPDEIDNPRTVDTHILSLRKKIEADPRQPSIIQTIRNVGYRFSTDRLVADTSIQEQSRNGGRPVAVVSTIQGSR